MTQRLEHISTWSDQRRAREERPSWLFLDELRAADLRSLLGALAWLVLIAAVILIGGYAEAHP